MDGWMDRQGWMEEGGGSHLVVRFVQRGWTDWPPGVGWGGVG